MEAAGLASSIISILDLTAKIVMRAREYMIDVKKSPAFLQNIENQLPLLAKCLEAIKRQALSLRITNEIAFELSHLVDNAFTELQRIDQYVRMMKPTDRSTSLQRFDRAVKSVLKYDAKIDSSMTKLRSYLDTLILYQSSISAGKTDDIARQLQSVKRVQTQLLSQDQITNIKTWIDGAPRDDYVDNILSRKAPGTCEWIFNTSDYLQWRIDLSSGKSKILWVHGPPGFGKTFVSATITSHLLQIAEPFAAVFWTSEGKFANSSLNDIPRSWIAQILALDEAKYTRLEEIRARSTAERANVKDIWQCLQTLLRASKFPVTLLLDGLDEYQQQQAQRQEQLVRNREASLKYTSVRDFLKELKTNIRGIACRFVCVSQQEAEIQSELALDTLSAEKIQSFEHNITQTDVKQDIKAYATFMVGDKLPKKTAALKTDLANLVASKAEGQMLWISLLQRDTSFLRPSFSDKKLRSIVESTPPGLDHIYHANLKTILGLPDGDKSRALRILYWVMHALRPLTVHELVEAILIEPNEGDPDDGDEFPDDDLPENPDEEDVFGEIKTLCGSFVTFDIDETKKNPRYWKTRFSHSSVRAFLMKNLPADVYDADSGVQIDHSGGSLIGCLCLRYLSYRNVWPEQTTNAEEGKLCLPEHPLLTYAATYWPLHLTDHNRTHMATMMSSFFKLHYDQFQKWRLATLNIRDLSKAGLAERKQWSFKNRLSFAASLGATSTVEDLCNAGDEVNPGDSTPLYAACWSGSVPTVQTLLDHGALMDKPISGGWKPVHQASSVGKIDVLKLLIEKGADINARSDSSWNAAHCAASGGHEDVLDVLMEANVDMLGLDSNGCHPLYYAIQQKHTKAADVIMKGKKEVVDKMVNHMSDTGWTPLATAAWTGNKDTAEALLGHGADPLQICDRGATPLYYSAERGHADVFRLLLNACDNVPEVVNKVTENYGRSMLHAGVRGKNLEIVEILLENGADVSRHDNDYYTALDQSIYSGSKDIVDLLLTKSSDVSAFKFWNPLMDAAEVGNAEMMRLLLDKGLDVNATTTENRNVLMIASRWGHDEVVKLILDDPNGKKLLNTKDIEEYSSLLWACEYGKSRVVKVLLGAGADYTIVSPMGDVSCLEAAAFSGDIPTVSILLEKCGPNAFDNKAILHSAAESGNQKLFDLLRSYYKITSEILLSGWTALHSAAKGGNINIINIVLNEGSADLIETRDHRGHRSLYPACQSGKVEGVRLLLQKYAEHKPPLNFDIDDVLVSVYTGDIDVVKALFNSDPEAFRNAHRGRWTPLFVACRRGHDAVIEFLLEKGFKSTDVNDYNESCLHAYAFATATVKTDKLFNNIDWKEALAVRDKTGMTPLLRSCSSGKAGAFRRYLKQGANINDVNTRSWTYPNIVRTGRTTLHYAVWSGSLEIVKLIVEAGGPEVLKLKTPTNNYLIHEAVTHDFMIEYLLEHGASLDVENVYGVTPLFKAISEGRNLSLTVLLRHGAGKIEKKRGTLIMAYAAGHNFFPTLRLLHKDGLELESRLTDGQTLLHIAASCGNEDNIEFLTQQGFDWDVRDDHGWTAHDCSLVSENVPGRDAPAEEIRKLDLSYLPPTKWALNTSENAVFKAGLNELQVVLKRETDDASDTGPPKSFTLTADHYLLPTHTHSYFEVTIDECPPSNGFAIGLDVFIGEHHRPMADAFVAAALFSEDGNFIFTGSTNLRYTSSFGQGDTMGCGIDYATRQLFFTKNGKCLGEACSLKGRYVPAISTMEKTFKVTGNFGQRAFVFDIESHGYGNKSCKACYGAGSYWNDWDGFEWYEPDSDDEDEDKDKDKDLPG